MCATFIQMWAKYLISRGLWLFAGVFGLIIGSFTLIILIIILIMLLFFGGCAAMMGVGLVENQRIQNYYEQALNSELPDNIEILVSDQGFSPFYDHNKAVLQNKNGRYAITAQGFYDFTTGKHTTLTCDSNKLNEYKNIPLSRRNDDRAGKNFWIGDEIFFWRDCVFEAETLRSGTTIEHQQSYNYSDTLEEANAKVQQVAQEIELDKIYYHCNDCYFDKIYFVQHDSTRPLVIHIIKIGRFIRKEVLLEIDVPSTLIPNLYEERRVQVNTDRLSPDGRHKAFFDGQTLKVKRVSDDTIVTELNVQEFHKIRSWYGRIEIHKKMTIDGWTDDSEQIVFSVNTLIEVDHEYWLISKFQPLLTQTFVLNVP